MPTPAENTALQRARGASQAAQVPRSGTETTSQPREDRPIVSHAQPRGSSPTGS